jgi:O-antigen ligase
MFKNYLSPQSFDLNVVKTGLIIFLIFSLLTGPFIPDLIVVFFAIFFLVNCINDKSYFNSKYFLFIFIFWLYLVVNSFLSLVALESLKSSIPYIRFLFFIFFIKIFFNNNSSLKVFLYSFLFIYLILLMDSIYQLSTGYNIFGYKLDSSLRVSSFFREELILGSFVSKTFAILLFLIFFLKVKYKYFFYVSVLLISGILVYLSRERSSFFVFFMTSLFSFFLIEKKFIFKILSIVISIFLLLIIIYNKPLERLYYHTKSQFKETGAIFLSERHKFHYQTAYRIFKEYPVFGAGLKSFRYLCDKKPYSITNEISLNKRNIITSTKDGYYFYFFDFAYSSYKSDAVLIIDKQFYEQYILNNKNDLFFIKRLLKSNSDQYIAYPIARNFYFNSKHKNFDYLEVGIDIFSYNEFKNGCNTHPHNFYMQFLSEIGVVGFLFLISFFVFNLKSLFIRIIKYMNEDKISFDIVIFGFYFSVFFPLLSSGNFFNNYNSLLLYLPLAFIIICQRK